VASLLSSAPSTSRPPARRFGDEVPRVFTPPLRELTRETSLGFAVIDFAADVVGITLFPWQRWLLIHALELMPDGSFRFRNVVILVARQNGKSTLSIILSLFFMYVLGTGLVIGTAQDLDVAEEIWQGAVDIVEETPELNDLKERVVKNNGKKSLDLKTGERYKVKAANRRAGRGLSGDLILLDELREHQSWDAWGAITKTTMARANAQVWALSNAGDASSIVLRYLRKMAHAAIGDPDGLNSDAVTDDEIPEDVEDSGADSLGIFEWSARPGCDVNDRDGWAQANPSMGHTITERTIASAAKTDPEWVFRTEVLCQWSEGTLEGPFPPGAWENADDRAENPGTLDNNSKRKKKSPIGVGLDTSWDRSTTYIAMAGWRKDGLIHVELMAQRAGTDWAIPWVAERVKRLNIIGVSFQANGAPVSSLVDEATAADIPFVPWAGPDLNRWTGLLYDKVRFRTLRHLVQPALDIAAATAVIKPSGDSWLWDRKNSPADAAPLIAVTAAVGALLSEEEQFQSAYADDGNDFILL
jgi:hypothetical protein